MQRILAIPLVLLAMLAAAVLWSTDPAEKPADFVFVNRGDIGTLDPNRMSWMQDIRIGYALYEGLYALDPQTLVPTPGMAGTIDVSGDRKVYTFHIRPTAGWSNGDPVLAKDFVFAWRRMLETPGDYTYLFDYIKGAKEYRTEFAAHVKSLIVASTRPSIRPTTRPLFSTVGIEILDTRVLRVTLKYPLTFFPEIVAFPPYYPLNERSLDPFKVVDSITGVATYKPEFIRPPNLVTNGPYRLQKWEFGKRLRLVASDYYWDRENVRTRTIEQVVIQDKLSEYFRFENGSVHWLSDTDPNIAAEIQVKGPTHPHYSSLKVSPAFGTYFYTLNCQNKLKDSTLNPFRDVRVRRAFAMAIDKRPIVQNVTRLGEAIAEHYVPPKSLPGYASPPGVQFNPGAARKLLADAGYPCGENFPPLRLTFNSESLHGEVAQVVRRQWLEQLNVKVDLEPIEQKSFSDRIRNQEYSVASASWYGDYDDVSTFTDKYLSDSDNNDSKWSNKRYDDLCAQALSESDPAKRLALLSQAEGILLDECPIIPLFYYTNKLMFRDNVKGLTLHPRNMVMFKGVWIDK